MKQTVYLFIVVFISISAHTQTKLDSLWNVWNDESKTEEVRIKAMFSFSRKGYMNLQPDSAFYFLQLAYDLAKQHELKKEMSLALNAQGIALTKSKDYPKALNYLQQSLRIGEEIPDSELIAKGLYNIGYCYMRQYDYFNAIDYTKRSIIVYEKLEDMVEVADNLYTVAVLYRRQGKYLDAIDHYQKSLLIYEELKNKNGVRKNLNSIGLVYSDQENHGKALEYFQKCLRISNELADKKAISQSLSNIAMVYTNTGKYSKAMENYLKSLEMDRKLGDKKSIGIVLFEIGQTYKLQGDYPNALENYFQCLELFEEESSKQYIAMAQASIGETYLKQNNYGQAIRYSNKALKIAEEINALEEQNKAAEVLYQSYKRSGKPDDALKYLELRWAITDSLKADDTDKKLQQLEFNRQRMADSLLVVEEKLKTELAYQETLSKEKQTRNTFMFVGLGILLIAGGLYGRMRYIRSTNKELAGKNKIIALEKERAEESEKAKEQFFDNVSHEFRTPLTLIIGPLEETLNKTINEKSRPSLEIMKRSAERLQGMINELLDLSKISSGKISLEAKEENIVKITRDYIQSFESLADQRRIKLTFKSGEEDYKVWIDLEKYRKILANLLSNAFKFTEEGGSVKVRVSSQQSTVHSPQFTSEIEPTTDWRPQTANSTKGVRISITDTGIGIPADKLPHIFDRFFQTGDKSLTHQAGTGIGLALTKDLVELHHGTIHVESETGKGSTFTIIIPFGKEHLTEDEMLEEKISTGSEENKEEWAVEEAIPGHVSEDEIRKKNDKPLVLIVEDNPDMLAYTKSHLIDEYSILEAKDGEEGLEIALEQIPDLVISDVMMPRMDGNLMTEKLKTDHRTNHIPVIILTARASVDSKIEGLETGADAYVTKPFNARELKTRVKKLIEQRQKLREHFAKEMSTGQPFEKSSSLLSMDQQFIQKAIDIVNKHISDYDFDVKEFTSEMAMSRAQLHRKIKALSNKTTSEFIRTIRLNKAAELLRQKTDNVTQIAYETGFSNLSWFTKAFKEQFGVTPSEYLKS